MKGSSRLHEEGSEVVTATLAARLRALAPLTKEQLRLLAQLETERRELQAGEELFAAGPPADELFILTRGWLILESFTAAGTRSIVRVHLPGDIVDAASLSYGSFPFRAVARSEAVVCPFQKKSLVGIFERSPRLSALLLCLYSIEIAEQEDRAAVFRRNNATAKLALFIQQTFGRLKLMNTLLHDRFHCPLNQTDIGDATGMSSVHVSRTFSKLEKEGLLERHGQFTRIVDAAALSELSGYTDRHAGLDLSWLPKD